MVYTTLSFLKGQQYKLCETGRDSKGAWVDLTGTFNYITASAKLNVAFTT